MTPRRTISSDLKRQNDELQARLSEAEAALEAIRNGEVDALLVSGPEGDQVYTLETADSAYRLLVESMNQGAATLLGDGSIFYSNRHLADMLKIPLEQLIGRPIDDFIDPADAGKFKALFKQSEHDGSEGDLHMQSAAAESIPVYIALNRLRLVGRETVCMAVTDLTPIEAARRIAETGRALEAERNILQSVMNGATNSHLVYLDRDFKFVRVNETYARGCGYTPEQMIGLNHFALYPNAENEEIFKRVRDTGEPCSVHDKPFEYPDQPERGVTYWDWTLSPVKDQAGQVVGLVLSLFDTTERKLTEEAIVRHNDILDGINQILSAGFVNESEADLGMVCIQIAERLTQSNFGIIGGFADQDPREIVDARTDWQHCMVADGKGNQLPSADFKIGGVYKKVLQTRESLFVNDPAHIAVGDGLPEGHPPLTAILAVPVFDKGALVGAMAVGNRDGGYTRIEREALEVLAPAIVEAFSRKRAEKALKLAHEQAFQDKNKIEAILQALPVGVAVIDINGGTIHSNQMFESIWGEGRPATSSIDDYVHFKAWWADSGEPVKPSEWASAIAIRTGEKVLEQTIRIERFDGRQAFVLNSAVPIRDAQGQVTGSAVVIQDITDRIEVEERLRQNREWLRVTLASIGDGVIATDTTGSIVFFNPVAEQLTGWSEREALGRHASEIFRILNEETGEPVNDMIERVLNEGSVIGLANHTVIIRRDGSRVPIEDSAAPIRDSDGLVSGVVLVFHDVTEKRRAQEALRHSENELRLIMDTVPALIAYVGPDLRYRRVNKGFEKFARRSASEIEGLSVRDIIGEAAWPRVQKEIARVMAGQIVALEQPLEYFEGSPWCQLILVPDVDASGQVHGYVAHIMDISERKKAEEALAELQRRQTMILDSIADGFYSVDRDWRFIHVNDAALAYFGASREEIIGKSIWEFFPTIAESQFEKFFRHAMDTGEPVHFIERSIVVPENIVEINAYPGADNLTVLFRNATERITREAELQKLNRTLLALSDSDRAMMRATNEPSYLAEVCRIVVEDCGHAMVWIGYAIDDAEKTVRSMAYSGFDEGYIKELNVSWADNERGRGPTGTAIRTGKISICRNMLTDPAFEPWRDTALARGYRSSLVLPLITRDETLGCLTIYSHEIDPFTEEEIGLLSRLADDLAHGIRTLREREALNKSEEELRRRAEEVESLMNLAPMAIWVAHDPECKSITGNREANRFYEAADGANVTAGDTNETFEHDERIFYQHGRKLSPSELPMQKACATGEDVSGSELEVELPSGRRIILLGNACPLFDGEGNVRGGIGSFVDITARKRAEADLKSNLARFELLAGTAGQLLQSTEPQRVIESLCSRVMEHLDCQAFFNFLIDEDSGRLRLNACAGVGEEQMRDLEWLDIGQAVCGCVARDGKPIIAEHVFALSDPRTELVKSFGIHAYASHPLLGPGGKVIGTLSFGTRTRETFSDADLSLMKAVTDQVAVSMVRLQVENNLRQSQAQLVDFNRTLEDRIAERTCQLDRLNAALERRARQLRALAQELTEAEEHERRRLADILHDDLQQLLVGAKLHLGLLPSRFPGAGGKELIAQVMKLLDESINKSRGLAQDLSPPLLRQGGLVATLEWLGRQMKSKYGLDVRLTAALNIELSEPLKVFLFRAAQEMLFNVVKHAGVSEAVVEVDNAIGLVRLTVWDQGRGFKTEGGLPANWGTSGFGLFSIQERANLLGGRLRIESAPGRGSRFVLEIPSEIAFEKTDQAESQPEQAGGEAPAQPGAVPTKAIRVLLVDDHQVMRQGLAAMLFNAPDIAVVGEAKDGRQAIDMVQACQPNVVIMDVSMPIMDGIEATRVIKRQWPGLRVIGLSMFEEEDLAQAMLESGAESYISKAMGLKELIDVIRKT